VTPAMTTKATFSYRRAQREAMGHSCVDPPVCYFLLPNDNAVIINYRCLNVTSVCFSPSVRGSTQTFFLHFTSWLNNVNILFFPL